MKKMLWSVALLCASVVAAVRVNPGGGGDVVRVRPGYSATPPSVWLDASTLLGVNGSQLALWRDLSGHGYDYTPIVTNRTPILETGVQNGKAGVRFDILPNFNYTAMGSSFEIAANQPFTAVCVFRCDQLGDDARRVLQGTTANWLLGPYIGSRQMYDGAFITDGTNDFAPHVLAATWTTIKSSFYSDGVLIGTNTPSSGPIGGAMGFGLGGGGAVTGETVEGWIFEVLIYDSVLSDAELSRLSASLMDKWF